MSRRRTPAKGAPPYTIAKFVFALLLLLAYEQRKTLAEARGLVPALGAGLLAVILAAGLLVWFARSMRRAATPETPSSAGGRPSAGALHRLPTTLGGMRVKEEAHFTRELLDDLEWRRFERLVEACRRAWGEEPPASPPVTKDRVDFADLLAKLNGLEETLRGDLYREITAGDYPTPTCPRCLVKMLPGGEADDPVWVCRNAPECSQTFPLSRNIPGPR